MSGSVSDQIITVQQIYAAFGQGDIPAILAHLAEDVLWEYGIENTEVPWLQVRQGRAQVPAFFEALQLLTLHRFEPKQFLTSDHLVVVLIDVELTVNATGITLAEADETHLWHFNHQGKVIKFAHRLDTHRHWLAYRGKTEEKPYG